MKKNLTVPMELQFFAEGAGGGGGASAPAAGAEAAGAVAEGAGKVEAAAKAQQPGRARKYAGVARISEQADKQSEQAPAAEQQTDAAASSQEKDAGKKGAETERDFGAEFDAMITGEYKDAWQKRIDGIVNRRFAAMKDMKDQLDGSQKLLAIVASQLEVDPGDMKALEAAIRSNPKHVEMMADQMGVSRETAESIFKNNQELAVLKYQEGQRRQAESQVMKQRQMEQQHQIWDQQIASAKAVYPGFNFAVEMKNPDFEKMVAAHVPIQHAYEVIHRNEIMGGAMQYTADKTREQIAKDLAARGNRPLENGASGQTATVQAFVYERLSKAAKAEIERRANRGERINPRDYMDYK